METMQIHGVTFNQSPQCADIWYTDLPNGTWISFRLFNGRPVLVQVGGRHDGGDGFCGGKDPVAVALRKAKTRAVVPFHCGRD